MTFTKRPHFVPQTYLRGWAGADEKVAYRRRDAAAILNGTKNVAVKSGIYGTGQLGQVREDSFTELEKTWTGLRDELISQGDLQGDERTQLVDFMAHQLTRTLKHSNQLTFLADVAASTSKSPITEDCVRNYLHQLDGSEPDDAEVYAAWTFVTGAPSGELSTDEAVEISMSIAAQAVAPRLHARDWTVRNFRQPALMTNDCPVHPWRRPAKRPVPGGVGVDTADEVRFPLSPGALLVMNRPGEQASNASTRSVNAEIAKQCHQFVVATPIDKPALDKVVFRKRPPRMRFRLGDGYTMGPDGTEQYLGEILHTWVD